MSTREKEAAARALRAAAREARIRGDVGKEDEGGVTVWDFLEWRAKLELGDYPEGTVT